MTDVRVEAARVVHTACRAPIPTGRTLIVLALVVVLASCTSDSPAPSPSGDGDAQAPGSTATTDTTATPDPHAGFPRLLAGSVVGGAEAVVAEIGPDGEIISIRRIAAPRGFVADVAVVGTGIVLSTCCEPAAGEQWLLKQGARTQEHIGFGTAVAGRDGGLLVVDPNGGFVRLRAEDASEATYTSLTGQWMPVDGALAPSGHIAVIAIDHRGRSGVFWLEDTAEFFDASPPLVTTGDLRGHPGRAAVDAEGKVWVVVFEEQWARPVDRVVIDPASGEVVRLQTEQAVVDQAFDATGRTLATVYSDGRVTWRSLDNLEETVLDLPPLDRVDW